MKKPFLYRKGTHDFSRGANRLDETADFTVQFDNFVSLEPAQQGAQGGLLAIVQDAAAIDAGGKPHHR